jgi:hypothetical protein
MKVRAWLTIATAALGSALVSCGHFVHTGNISLHVTVASDVPLREVDYQVTSIGFGQVTGSIRSEEPSTSFTRLISHVPAGHYLVHVEATSIDGQLTCEGSTQLDVRANATTRVNLGIGCRNVSDGMVHITVGVACPGFQVASWTISPLAASVGSTIAVSAATTDADAGPVVFHWTASMGTFASPNDAHTTYTCAAPGSAILTVTASREACRDTQSVPVTCVADAGASDAP